LIRRALDPNYIPTEADESLTLESLLQDYMPEPEVYTNHVLPWLRRQALETPEDAPGEASPVDTDNLKANFGIAMTYLSAGDKAKALEIVCRMADMDLPFEEEHKHLLNEFGSTLRKQALHETAVKYYEKALRVSPQDEHLCMNIARLHLEMAMDAERTGPSAARIREGNLENCLEKLKRGLELNPVHAELRQFLRWMVEKRYVGEKWLDWAKGVLDGPAPQASSA
jgi:tetratricopeptide (TPR) repeat protein